MLLQKIRTSIYTKAFSILLVAFVTGQCVNPLGVYAITGGPSQPETQSFEPVGTTEMVDLFTGDFVYNIPLMDVGGYPINISYHSGITMDQEASWVGLGWNINPGTVNRNMRGIPDDFSRNDSITKTFTVKDNETISIDGGLDAEIAGGGFGLAVGVNAGIYINNYRGIGVRQGASANVNAGPFGISGQFDYDTEEGISMGVGGSFCYFVGASVMATYNSRKGWRDLSIAGTASYGGYSHTTGEYVIDFVGRTYTPYTQPPMSTGALTFTLKAGYASTYVFANGYTGCTYSTQRVDPKVVNYPSYGYLYAEEGVTDLNGIQDLTREKESGFSKFKKYLPITQHTYDVYSYTGQGTGGVFRPHRGDIGTISDASGKSVTGTTANFTLEAGVGGTPPSAKIGTNIQVASTYGETGKWVGGNTISERLRFVGATANTLYEPVYFKNTGEKNITDSDFAGSIGDEKAVEVVLSDDFLQTRALPLLRDNDHALYPIAGPVTRKERDRRNQSITHLTAFEASRYGLEKKISTYKRSPSGGAVYGSNGSPVVLKDLSRVTKHKKKNHISEITSLNPDGSRYVYGLPVYNLSQTEASFTVSKNAHARDCATGLIGFGSTDNTIENDNGKLNENYFSSSKVPGYAYSYLLTAVLSPDYIDLSGNGPSFDDYGSYTKVNYSMVYGEAIGYNWRTPFSKAHFEENYRSDNKPGDLKDDKASYVYGTKEIWYMNSIETKTHVAEFHVSPRDDSKGATSESQQTNSMTGSVMKLDSIRLFSKMDIIENGANAVPVKVVHFAYNYELCKNTVNSAASGGGKLTLKEIWFTYGNNKRGELHKYKFDYGNVSDADENPDYNERAYNRWGGYKAQDPSLNCTDLANIDFPYVNQEETKNDTWAGAWHLKKIELPSGGIINVSYESDDYSHVQNKEAMEMMTVAGVGNSSTFNPMAPDSSLFTPVPGNAFQTTPNLYLFFKMRTGKVAATDTEVKDYYVNDIKHLYFKCLTNITDPSKALFEQRADYVSGFAEIEDAGVSSNSSYAWVKVKAVDFKDKNDFGNMAHPISKTAWQFLRLYRTDLAYPPEQPVNMPASVQQLISLIDAHQYEAQLLVNGYNQSKMMENCGRYISLPRSWIRLREASGFKKGGGTRVREISIGDEWSAMTGGEEDGKTYGTTYSYTMENANGETVSSGVASYEPLFGGDENPFRQPLPYEDTPSGAPVTELYVERPLGEIYFPGPDVGYRKVTTRTLKPSVPGTDMIIRHASGKNVYQFYTAAEFPTVTSNTSMTPVLNHPFTVGSFLGITREEYSTASQGFAIELNDMHGKLRAVWSYSETDENIPVSGTEYIYKMQNGSLIDQLSPTVSKLSNDVTVLRQDGTYATRKVGEDIEMVVDANRQFESNTLGGGLINLDLAMFGPLPIPILPILPEFSMSEATVQSISTTKIIHRQGILDKVIEHDNGAMLATYNLAWDEETGEVLYTKAENEFGDFTYGIMHPAYWAYDGMGPAYRNVGTTVSFTTNNGLAVDATLADILVPGDELIPLAASQSYSDQKMWVLDVRNDSISVVYRNGRAPQGLNPWLCKISRSGRRNMQLMPMASLTSKESFLDPGTSTFTEYSGVLESSAMEFSDEWRYYKRFRDCGEDCDPTGYTVPAADAALYYVDLMNQLFTMGEFNTGGAPEPFTFNMISVQLLVSNLAPLLLVPGSTYNTSESLACNDSNVMITFDLTNTSGSTNTALCDFRVYSQLPVSQTGTSLINNIAYIIPQGEVYEDCRDLCIWEDVVPQRMLRLTVVLNDGLEVPVILMTSCTPSPAYQTEYPMVGNNKMNPPNDTINPYVYGVRGNWRPLRSFVYYDTRNASARRTQTTNVSTFNQTDIRNDGTIDDYVPLWSPPVIAGTPWSMGTYNTTGSPWIWQLSTSLYHPLGMEIESKDALGNFSAAVYGFWSTLPVGVAQNALSRQILYDGFEDYVPITNVSKVCLLPMHTSFMDSLGTSGSLNDTGHTGNFSLKVLSGQTVSVTYKTENFSYATTNPSGLRKTFISTAQDAIEQFSPLATGTYTYGSLNSKAISGKYILSYWIRSSNVYSTPANPVTIKYDNTNLTLTNTGNDRVVEGWKRIERSFTIPSSAGTSHAFRILLTAGTGRFLFDDIRIHPEDALMTTYAYDYKSMRLMATHDENNYSTFYEYDAQGELVRVKRETEKGILMINESRQRLKNQ